MQKGSPVSVLSAIRSWTFGCGPPESTGHREKVRQMGKREELLRRYEKLSRAAMQEMYPAAERCPAVSLR